jgi:hypothetical protein
MISRVLLFLRKGLSNSTSQLNYEGHGMDERVEKNLQITAIITTTQINPKKT